MKNLFVLLLGCVMIASLGSCGEKVNEPEPPVDVWSLIPDPAFQEFCRISLPEFDTNGDGILSHSEAAEVKSLSIFNDNEIQSLEGIEYFPNLETLLCTLCDQLTDIDISKNQALTWLDCSGNRISSLDVSKNKLIELDCSKNPLFSLDVSQNTELMYLVCTSCFLSSIDVSKNEALEVLDLYNNMLTSLDVRHNTALKELGCSVNFLTMLDIRNNTALHVLLCNDNQMYYLDASKMANASEYILYCGRQALPEGDNLSLLLREEQKAQWEVLSDHIYNERLELVEL